VPIKACRKLNNNKELNIAEVKTIEINLNKKFGEWLEFNDAEKFCFSLKTKYDLKSYNIDHENLKISLTGLDNHIEGASK